MRNQRGLIFFLAFAYLLFSGFITSAQSPDIEDPLVDLEAVDDTILVELRYATSQNITGKPLYPAGARCLVRTHVAQGLKVAQDWLRPQGFGLKILDAYRTPAAQKALWESSKNPSYVAPPDSSRSLHTWGVAVDVTLVDSRGNEMKMPTAFDVFSPAAASRYRGSDPLVARNLRLLQTAMKHGGFLGMRTEWWHFVGKQWRQCRAVQVSSMLPGPDGLWHPQPALARASE